MKKIWLSLPVLMLCASVKAAPVGQFCIKNHTSDSYFAFFSNVSVGVKVLKNGKSVIESSGGDPLRISWGDEYCIDTQLGDNVRLYRKSFLSGWEYRRSYDMKLLDGLDLHLGKAGRLDEEMGFSLKYDAEGFEEYHPARWMSQLFSYDKNDTKLRELCIPGTHGSGSYQSYQPMTIDPHMSSQLSHLSDRFINSKINVGGFTESIQGKERYLNWWVKTQSKTIKEQLDLGARYLGMKVVHHNGGFFTARGLVGVSTNEVFDQIKEFLDKNKDEIVILHFYDARSLDRSQHQLFFESVEEKLGELLLPKELGLEVTVESVYKTPGRVIILYQPNDYNAPEWLWKDSTFVKRFHANEGNSNLFLKKMQRQHKKAKPSGMFEVTDMYLTPSSSDFDAFGSSLTLNWGKDFAGTLKYLSGITQYVSREALSVDRHLNIVSHDYIEEGDLFASCMAINQRWVHGEPERSHESSETPLLPFDESAEEAEGKEKAQDESDTSTTDTPADKVSSNQSDPVSKEAEPGAKDSLPPVDGDEKDKASVEDRVLPEENKAGGESEPPVTESPIDNLPVETAETKKESEDEGEGVRSQDNEPDSEG